jgi:hypothetical protein
MIFKGELTLYFDGDDVKGEFLDAHDLEENDYNNVDKVKPALVSEVYSWLECMNIGVDLKLEEVEE